VIHFPQMRNLKRLLTISILLLAGCSVLSSLEAVINATASAVPILEAAGVNVPPQAVTYIDAVANCAGSQNGSTAPTDQQILAIAACMASQIAPTLPPGTASAIVSIVGAVAKDVANFLAQHPPAAPNPQTKLASMSAGDQAKVAAIEAKAAGVHAKLKALKH